MGLFVILLFLILVFVGVPIGVAMLVPSIIYLVVNDLTLTAIAQKMTYSLDSFALLAVPVFIFVGSLLNASGITSRIFSFANSVVGHFPGGLSQVNILASLIMAGTSGSALADIGGTGKAQIHAMTEKGYTKEYSAAITAASATVGPIFPPSIPLIMFGVISQTSVISLLIGGIVPAILTVVLLMAFTHYLAKKHNFPKAEKRSSFSEMFRSFWKALPALLTPVLLIAGMLAGIFSPTEAAVITVIYVLLISVFIYKEFTFTYFVNACIDAVQTTVSIMFIVAAAALFGWVITLEQIPQLLGEFLRVFAGNQIVLLLVVNVIILIIGCFMETMAALFLLTPLLVPPLVSAGLDPVHIGMIIVFNLMLGLLTPPMGMSLFLSAEIAKAPIEAVLRNLLPYFIPLLLTLVLITYFPQLTLWIPSLLD